MYPALATAYLRWSFLRAALTRGYWLATALYLVVVAGLTPAQLVLIGTAQALTAVVAEVPAGALADTIGRRRALVVAHAVTGAGMAMAGLVTSFPLLAASQCVWGLGWACASGADVAWVTDELDRPDVVDRVLVAQARWSLLGEPVGMVAFAALAWATTLSTAVVASGVAMAALGLAVVRWPEARFEPVAPGRRIRESVAALRHGLRLARTDRVVLLVVAATVLVHGATQVHGRLRERRLVALGIPAEPDPVVWFALVGIAGVAVGAVALRFVEARIAGAGAARRTYALAAATGAVALVLFAHAPDVATAVAGSLLLTGAVDPVGRVAAAVWVNRRTPSAVRATVHSLLSQAEHAGETVFGLALAAVASAASGTVALTASAAVMAGAVAVVAAARPRPSPAPDPAASRH